MLTYWHQISEILKTNSKTVLEIGIGSGLVTNYLRYLGLDVKTADINANLNPDFHASILDFNDNIGKYDLVVCCRVLHHIEFDKLGIALDRISSRTNRYAIITLPVDEARIYFMGRITASPLHTFSFTVPHFIKRQYSKMSRKAIGSGLWQINSSKDTSLERTRLKISEYFNIVRGYQLPEDKSHYMFVLEKI